MSTQVIDFNNVENVVFDEKEVDVLKLNDTVMWKAFKKLEQLIDGTITEVTAEDLDGVTKIGQFAFYGCSNLTSVTLPEGLTNLGTSAFDECPLTEITFPSSITSIGQSCFQHCNYLNTVRFLSLTPPTLGASCLPWSDITRCEVPIASLDQYKSSIPELEDVMVGV